MSTKRAAAGRPAARASAAAVLAMAMAMATPAMAWAAGFDSIVIDDDLGGARGNGDYAVGQGRTRVEAERIAMSNCTLGGNVACTVKVTYAQCGAYAASPRRGASGVGPSLEAASAAARLACGGDGCRLVVADCVDRPLAPPR